MIFRVEVNQCNNLKREDLRFDPKLMQPFFSYDFYTFGSYQSPVATGANPNYGIVKTYEVEDSKEFRNYMRS